MLLSLTPLKAAAYRVPTGERGCLFERRGTEWLSTFLFAVVSGILFGVFFSLMAIGLNFAFGVMKIVNLAHGDFVMLGAFGAYYALGTFGINPFETMIMEIVVFLVVGVGLYYGIIPRLLRSDDPEMLSLILFFGISQVIEALATLAFGTNPVTLPTNALGQLSFQLFGQAFESSWVISFLVSVVAIGLLYVYLYKTKMGIATRAIMANRDEAAASGIDVNRISAIAFGIALVLAAIAGTLTPFMLGGIYPSVGVNLTITSFSIIVIGSLGNPIGTVVGGLVYGLSLLLMQTYLSSWANMVPYVLLILILLIKPSGLLGKGARNA